MDLLRRRLLISSYFYSCNFLKMLYLFVSPRSVDLNRGRHDDRQNRTHSIADCQLTIADLAS
jgi:hypothetical protein